jgi:hypothetical protein
MPKEFTGDPGPAAESTRRAPLDLAPKVKAGGIGGSLAVLLMFVAAQLGVELPETVALAIGVLVTWAASYVKQG